MRPPCARLWRRYTANGGTRPGRCARCTRWTGSSGPPSRPNSPGSSTRRWREAPVFEVGLVHDALRPAVETACAEIRRVAPRYLGGADVPTLTIEAVQVRTHSVTTRVGLSSGGRRQGFYLKTL